MIVKKGSARYGWALRISTSLCTRMRICTCMSTCRLLRQPFQILESIARIISKLGLNPAGVIINPEAGGHCEAGSLRTIYLLSANGNSLSSFCFIARGVMD